LVFKSTINNRQSTIVPEPGFRSGTKYVIMYFDNEFPRRSLFQDYLYEYMNHHRTYLPPKKVRVNMEEAARLFETSWEKLKKMDLKCFNRLYRKMALKHHPDKGGTTKHL
jgi:hypothetical protein